MSSINAENVAKDVLERVGKGLKVDKGDIIRKNGYAESIAINPKKVTRTKSYKKVMEPLIKQLEDERQEIIFALIKTRSKAKYRDLMDGLDKTTKTIQLLSGGDTEKTSITIQISETLAKRYGIKEEVSPKSALEGQET